MGNVASQLLDTSIIWSNTHETGWYALSSALVIV